MTNGAGSPAKGFDFLRAMPPRMMIAMPITSISAATYHMSLKKSLANIAMMTVFAPQGMNVAKMIVMRRSRSFSIVRAAMTAGTPHPFPTIIGMNDLPERPNLRNMRSMMNATRAMYPQSSRNARKRNTTKITGTNPSTVETPPHAPSFTRLETVSLTPSFSSPDPMSALMPGTQNPNCDGSGSSHSHAALYDA